MSVSHKVGAALVARRWWCAPGEPVIWAFQVESRTFRVEGCNEFGRPLPPKERKSFSTSVGRAAGKAGLSAATVLATAAFGGGDDGRMLHSEPTKIRDLTVLGDSPDCRAVQLHNSERPPNGSAAEQVWVLTPSRFSVLIPVDRPAPVVPEESSGWQEWGKTLSGMGRVLAGTEPERFGRNTPGEEMNPERMVEWLSFASADFVDCQAVVQGAEAQCVLTLQDGSGFALNVRSPEDARYMAGAVQAFVQGRQWGARG